MQPRISARPHTRPYLALLAVCLAAAAMPLTFTATAVALPSIAQALDASPVATAWATNAFMLTFGSTLMVAGALADSLGRRRVFLLGAASLRSSRWRSPWCLISCSSICFAVAKVLLPRPPMLVAPQHLHRNSMEQAACGPSASSVQASASVFPLVRWFRVR